MNINKKFDRMKQWGKERMGGEVKTGTNEEFKALELEMQLRGDGMGKLKKSADVYVQHMAKREKYQEKEQQTPVGYFGSTMITHGDDFEPESEFGQCLALLGRANERIARMQETYCANATSTWLESLERSLVQMKEYEKARKQLDSRRLAYDTASVKMQKSKKEDFRMEEELRTQKMKYEETSEDVYRRMLDIKEAEGDSVQDLTSFLDAELAYYDRCREVLVQLKRDWPVSTAGGNRSDSSSPVNGRPNNTRQPTRSRGNSINDRFARIAEDEALEPPRRPTISSRVPSGGNSPAKELQGFDLPSRPNIRSASSTGFEAPMSLSSRSESPAAMPRLARVPTEPTALLGARSNLRITKARDSSQPPSDVFGDDQSEYSPSRLDDSHRTPSWGTMANDGRGATTSTKKAPPPPPPSRAKKPPPPPPMKRSALSTSEVPRY